MYIVSKKHDVNGFEVGRLFKDFPTDKLLFNDFMPCDGKEYPRKQFPELARLFHSGDIDTFRVPYIPHYDNLNIYNITFDEFWEKLLRYPEYKYVEENFI